MSDDFHGVPVLWPSHNGLGIGQDAPVVMYDTAWFETADIAVISYLGWTRLCYVPWSQLFIKSKSTLEDYSSMTLKNIGEVYKNMG